VERPRLRPGWFSAWWHHGTNLYLTDSPPTGPVPPGIQHEFESVTDLGVKDVVVNGEIIRRLEIFECKNLRGGE
jgi:hypothetical protein